MITCQTCRHWDRRYLKNRDLGICTKMGAIRYDDDIALNLADHWTDAPPTSDVRVVRTLATFGCVGHVRHGTTLLTLETMR